MTKREIYVIKLAMVKFFVIAGEASGDLHASFLIRQLKKKLPESKFYGIGGDKMRALGVELVCDIKKISVVGFLEAFMKINEIRRVFRRVIVRMREVKPDALILVDFPGFNLRLAPVAKLHGIKVFYYITPQVWAWGHWRLRSLFKNIDHALVIFPFEERMFSAYGIKATFVGHPVLDEMTHIRGKEKFCTAHNLNSKKPIVALLPGSRRGEIKRLLPIMLKIVEKIRERRTDVQFILPTISDVAKHFILKDGNIKIIFGETSSGINTANAAIAASGSVTLETALLGIPTVIIYKLSLLSYLIVRVLIKLPYIGLVNIVRGRKIVPEFIQFSINVNEISKRILKILEGGHYANQMKEELLKVKGMLGKRGASQNAAEIILAEVVNR